MTASMTVKDWLRSVRGIEGRIKALEDKKKRLRALAYKAGVGSMEATRISGSGNRSRVEDAVCNALEMEEMVAQEIAAALRLMKDVRFMIDQVGDRRLRSLLDMRYLSCWDWKDIAAAMHYDPEYAMHLHGKALIAADEVLRQYPDIVKRNGIKLWEGR